MEVKKFEALGSENNLLNITKIEFLKEIFELLSNSPKIFGYEIVSTYFNPKDETILINIDNKIEDSSVIKLDVSDLGIEIGNVECDEETGDIIEFIPKSNLNTEITKNLKDQRKNIDKYNL